MLRGLLNGFPKRQVPVQREYPPSSGPKVQRINQPHRPETLTQFSGKANSGADNHAMNIGLSESGTVSELVNSLELQQLVNNQVKSEQMKTELNDSLEVLVGKVVTANLRANGVDLSFILTQKVLETIAQESSKQLLGVANNQAGSGAYEINNISEIGSTSNKIMIPDVAKQSFPPERPVDNSSKAIMDMDSTITVPAMSFPETKFPKRRVLVNREYPPFCGRNAPCPTEEERLRLISGKRMRGEEVTGSSGREVFSKPKKLDELARGKEVTGVSAREMFPKVKNSKELGRPSRNNTVRDISSTAKGMNSVAHAKPLNLITGSQNINMRDKVRKTLSLFRTILNELLQKEKKIRRVDFKAAKMIKEKGKEVNTERQWIGSVPGVEVGDEFHYRAELMIIGLHRLPQGGIDYMKNGSVIVATSIIASGGYSDDMANADVLIYTGQGGNNTGRNNEPPKDQEMERGNLALKNCITTRAKVRVTRGFETKATNMRARITYTYDGLYTVEKFWNEREQHGKLVFKFELMRVPGQPRVAWKRGEVKFQNGSY